MISQHWQYAMIVQFERGATGCMSTAYDNGGCGGDKGTREKGNC